MTQIKATILTGGNHIETVSFPCSDDEIMRLTEQNEIGHKATVFINNLVGPKGLKSIEGTYANIHELNYLAKRMDSFDGTEMGKLLAAASRFDTRDLRQLINYTFPRQRDRHLVHYAFRHIEIVDCFHGDGDIRDGFVDGVLRSFQGLVLWQNPL